MFRHKISKKVYCINPKFPALVCRVEGEQHTYDVPFCTTSVGNLLEYLTTIQLRAFNPSSYSFKEFTDKSAEFLNNVEIIMLDTKTDIVTVVEEKELRLFEALKR